jgi:hypothetical protein
MRRIQITTGRTCSGIPHGVAHRVAFSFASHEIRDIKSNHKITIDEIKSGVTVPGLCTHKKDAQY